MTCEKNLSGKSQFVCIKSLSSSLSTNTTLPKWRQHRLDHELSRETSIKYDSFHRTGAIEGGLQHLLGPRDWRALLSRSSQELNPSEEWIQFSFEVMFRKIIFSPLLYKKNKQLSVCVLSGYEQRRSRSTTVTTGPWSFRGVCKNTRSSSSQAKTPVRWLFVAFLCLYVKTNARQWCVM